MPTPTSGKPTPREVIDNARAAAAPRVTRAIDAAGPRVSKAVDAAGPKLEKAAETAGSLLGTLRARAKEAAKQFNEGLSGSDAAEQAPPPEAPAAVRRRPRPGPH